MNLGSSCFMNLRSSCFMNSDFQSIHWCNFIISKYLSCRGKIVLILISWLLVKPAYLNQHCFQKTFI